MGASSMLKCKKPMMAQFPGVMFEVDGRRRRVRPLRLIFEVHKADTGRKCFGISVADKTEGRGILLMFSEKRDG